MSKVILTTSEELLQLIRPLFEELKNTIQPKEERLLSPAETCKLFNPPITKPTLTSWTEKGYLTAHQMGCRVYYKQSEVMSQATVIKKYKSLEK